MQNIDATFWTAMEVSVLQRGHSRRGFEGEELSSEGKGLIVPDHNGVGGKIVLVPSYAVDRKPCGQNLDWAEFLGVQKHDALSTCGDGD